jgi:hypothetical protein
VVDVLGRPAADMTAAMQEDFEEADDARVVDLDAGIAHRADCVPRKGSLMIPIPSRHELEALPDRSAVHARPRDDPGRERPGFPACYAT